MKKLGRITALLLVLSLIFAQSVFAAESSARDVYMQATQNSIHQTSYLTTGDMRFTLDAAPFIHAEIAADFHMPFALDLSEGLMKFYLRTVLELVSLNGLLIDGLDLDLDILDEIPTDFGMFFDGTDFFLDIGDGWFSVFDLFGDLLNVELEGLFELDEDMFGDDWFFGMDMDEYLDWALELLLPFYDLIPMEFAPIELEGYYIVDTVIDNDFILEFATSLLTIDTMFAILDWSVDFITEFDPDLGAEMANELAVLDDLSAADLQEIQDAFDEVLVMLETGLELVDINFLIRSYIDVETLNFQRITMLFTVEVDLQPMLFLPILGVFEFEFTQYVDYDAELVWPDVE